MYFNIDIIEFWIDVSDMPQLAERAKKRYDHDSLKEPRFCNIKHKYVLEMSKNVAEKAVKQVLQKAYSRTNVKIDTVVFASQWLYNNKLISVQISFYLW